MHLDKAIDNGLVTNLSRKSQTKTIIVIRKRHHKHDG